jgi:hypothetical protein
MSKKAGQWGNVQDKAPKSEKKQENPANSWTVGKYTYAGQIPYYC